jgi:hypothetical protein
MLYARTIKGRSYVYVMRTSQQGYVPPIAIMERSPFTGEYGYGMRMAAMGAYGQTLYQPATTPTRRKSIPAALKVIAAEIVDDAFSRNDTVHEVTRG